MKLVALMLALVAAAVAAVQWQPAEFSFTGESSYERPFTEVDLRVEFRGPTSEVFLAPGFHDGGRTWKVRFAPTAPGQWRYRTAANVRDAGLDGREGSFTAHAAASDNPLYRHGGFLKVSGSRRYLTYADGTPFFWLGDTWWFCPSSLVPLEGSSHPEIKSAFRALIDKRREQGFSVVQMAFLGPMPASRGVNSLSSQMAARRPDLAYWSQVDRYIAYANDAGIIPVIGLAFHTGMEKNSLEEWKFLWRYVVARYGAHAVTWMICGEYNLQRGDAAGRVEKTLALGAFIKETDPYKRAMSVHPWYYGGDKRQAWEETWYDFIMIQGGHPGRGKLPPTALYLEAWHRDRPKPVLEAELNYEGIHGGKDKEVTADDVRRSAYHAIQSGSFGYTYGAHGLWYPTQNAEDKTFSDWGVAQPWWQAMQKTGAAQMAHLRAFYEAVRWWELEPRPDAVTCREKPPAPGPLLKAAGERRLVVYFPEETPAGVECNLRLGSQDGGYRARWFDPRSGVWSRLPDQVPSPGLAALPPRPGAGDWLLVLDKGE